MCHLNLMSSKRNQETNYSVFSWSQSSFLILFTVLDDRVLLHTDMLWLQCVNKILREKLNNALPTCQALIHLLQMSLSLRVKIPHMSQLRMAWCENCTKYRLNSNRFTSSTYKLILLLLSYFDLSLSQWANQPQHVTHQPPSLWFSTPCKFWKGLAPQCQASIVLFLLMFLPKVLLIACIFCLLPNFSLF